MALKRVSWCGGSNPPAPSDKVPHSLSNQRIFALALAGVLVISGCASTVTTTHPDGRVTEVKAGFGNKLVTPEVTVEPSQTVVESGERLGREVVTRASERIMQHAIEQAAQSQQVQN